jgi:hypothetical protein
MIALRIRQRLNQHRRQRTLTGRPATNRRRPTSQLPPCRALQARPSNQVRGSEISLDTCTVGLHEQVETATKYSQVAVETPSTVRAQLAISTSTNNATFELLDHNTRDGVSKCRRRRNGRRGRSLDGSGKRSIFGGCSDIYRTEGCNLSRSFDLFSSLPTPTDISVSSLVISLCLLLFICACFVVCVRGIFVTFFTGSKRLVGKVTS